MAATNHGSEAVEIVRLPRYNDSRGRQWPRTALRSMPSVDVSDDVLPVCGHIDMYTILRRRISDRRGHPHASFVAHSTSR